MSSRFSSLALILANLLPLVGVLYFDWQILDILLLYWSESVIIGIVNVLRMAQCGSDNILAGLQTPVANPATALLGQIALPRHYAAGLKTFLILFFTLHYGAFCIGHLTVVRALFSDEGLVGEWYSSLALIWQPAFIIAAGSIAASHLYSFAINFIGKREYENTGLIPLMQRPYGRIVAMHVAIVFGGGLVMWLGTALPLLVILIAVKIGLDLRFHQSERVKLAIQGQEVAR
jgi:hypothetical protein